MYYAMVATFVVFCFVFGLGTWWIFRMFNRYELELRETKLILLKNMNKSKVIPRMKVYDAEVNDDYNMWIKEQHGNKNI